MSPKKVTNRLTALDVTRKGKGMHLDGAGLYLQVTEQGRSWIFRFKSPTKIKNRYMGRGPIHTYGLAQARERAAEARRIVNDGKDPIDQRKAERASARLAASKDLAFEIAVEKYIDAHRNSWKTAKHEAQWRSSL